jgi:hypothetical protein
MTDMENLGSVHIRSCICFDSIEQLQEFLSSVEGQWNTFSFIPHVFEMKSGMKPEALSIEDHKNFIWPYTYRNRKMKEKLDERKTIKNN